MMTPADRLAALRDSPALARARRADAVVEAFVAASPDDGSGAWMRRRGEVAIEAASALSVLLMLFDALDLFDVPADAS